MTKKLALISCFSLFTFSAFAKIVYQNDRLYLKGDGEQRPLLMVNELIASNKVSKVKLYGGGDVRLISFSKGDSRERLYSVDHKGFIYSIAPFSNYTVSKVNQSGTVEFKQVPGRRYKIDKNGYFLY